MSRTVITARNRKRMQTRHACLTNDRLVFSKSHHDDESPENQSIPDLDITTDELWSVFDEFDDDKAGYQHCIVTWHLPSGDSAMQPLNLMLSAVLMQKDMKSFDKLDAVSSANAE